MNSTCILGRFLLFNFQLSPLLSLSYKNRRKYKSPYNLVSSLQAAKDEYERVQEELAAAQAAAEEAEREREEQEKKMKKLGRA